MRDTLSAALNLANTTIGVGILSLSFVASKDGLLFLLVILLPCIAILSSFTAHLLVRTSSHILPSGVSGGLYEALGYAAGGNIGRYAVELSMIIDTFGVLVVLLIVLGDIISPLMPSSLGDFAQPIAILFPQVLFVFPLSLLRTTNSLRFSSFISVLCYCLFAIVLVITAGEKNFGPYSSSSDTPVVLWSFDFRNLFYTLPIIGWAFVSHPTVLIVFKELAVPTIRNMNKAIALSAFICYVVYTLVSGCGYLLFRSESKGDFLVNLGDHPDNVMFIIVRASFFVSLVSTCPLFTQALRTSLQTLLNVRAHITSTVMINFLAYGAAVFIPSVTTVLSLVGATACSSIAFVLPGILYVLYTRKTKSYDGSAEDIELIKEEPASEGKILKHSAIFSVCFGVTIGLLGTTVVIIRIVNGKED